MSDTRKELYEDSLKIFLSEGLPEAEARQFAEQTVQVYDREMSKEANSAAIMWGGVVLLFAVLFRNRFMKRK